MAEQLPAPFKLTWEDKLEKAEIYKKEGNERFKAKAYKTAIGKYHRAMLYLKGIDASKQGSLMPSVFGDRETEVKMPKDVQKDFVKLKADCYNNLAACILLTESPTYEKVLQYCDEVIQLSPNNAKAIYRKGVALYNLSRLDDALEELLKAQSLPTGMKDQNIKRYIGLCQQQAKQQNKMLRQKYRAMFERMSEIETCVTSDTSVLSDRSVHSGSDIAKVDTACSPVTKDVGGLEISAASDDVTNESVDIAEIGTT